MPEEVQLTPEQQAQYEQAAGNVSPQQSAEIDPIRDLDATQLADLSVKDPSFNLVETFRAHPDRSPQTVQKVADAFDTVSKRGFKLSDLPNPVTAVPKAVYEFGKGALKQAWNYANAGAAAVAGAVVGGKAEDEMIQEAQRRVAENFAGTEQAVTGLSNTAQSIGRKAANLVTGGETTPDQRVKNLWDAVGRGEVSEDISKGHGAFMSAVGGNVIQELEQAGKPVRPEETSTLAAGDPFTFWAFGKAIGGAGQVLSKVPGVQAATSAVGTKLAEVAPKIGGKAIQAAGSAVEGAGKVAEVTGKVIKTAGPIIEAGRSIIQGDLSRAMSGVGEYYGGSALKWLGQQAPTVARPIKEFGKQVAGQAITPGAQAVKDIFTTLPSVAGETAKGAAIDLGLAAASSESPEQTQQALGMGTAFGALGGARKAAGHVISGQIVAPRAWGSNTPVSSSGNFPALNAVHSAAYTAAPRGVQTRVNAVRQFLQVAAPGTDAFLSDNPAALEKALVDSGVAPEIAKTWASQNGFFTADLGGKRVVVMSNPDAAPHEAFHAFQDVLGEEGNRAIDKIVMDEYGNQWEAEGKRYAARLGVTGDDWRTGLLDITGWGRSEAVDKLTTSIENQLESDGQQVDPDFVRQRVEGEWNQLREQAKANNPQATPQEVEAAVWRDVLSPDDAKEAADRYIAREIAAENFDAIFKAQGPQLLENNSLLGRLARVAANVLQAIGQNPLEGRTSQIGKIDVRPRTAEAVRSAALENIPAPAEGAKPVAPVAPVAPEAAAPAPAPAKPEVTAPASPEAEKLRDWTTKNPITVPDRAKAANTIANAIDNEQVVQVTYWGAKGEPGGSIGSERPERRTEIEAQRDADNADRPLVRKTFFPERVETTGKGAQIVGWSPDNFYANAQKLAAWIDRVGDSARQKFPYQTDGNGNFTEAGWKELQADLNSFMQNQRAGRTGAGEALVVPKETIERGFRQPAKEGAAAKIDQDRADVLNYLFNVQIPEGTSRVAPLHIAGQEVSEATQPGRVTLPVRPRGEYTEAQLTKAGIAGPRGVREVNPLRNWIDQAARSSGVEPPSLIDVSQRLNINRVADATIAPEVPPVRANTLTLAAGFQPRLAEEPEAIRKAAIRAPSGKIYTETEKYPTHYGALKQAVDAGEKVTFQHDLKKAGVTPGFVTNSGEFLDRTKAFKRAKEYGQITGEERMPNPGQLESVIFEAANRSQFQPSALPDEVSKMSAKEFRDWAATQKGGFTHTAYEVGRTIDSQEAVDALKANANKFQAEAMSVMKDQSLPIEQRMDDMSSLAAKSQFFNEAWQFATGTGSGGESAQKEGFTPKFKAQAQPEETGAEFKKSGLAFKPFFSSVTKGTFGKSNVPFEPVLDLSDHKDQSFIEEQDKHTGNFDEHIAKSIPTFKETQIRKGRALVAALPDGSRVLDVGASEGSLMKTISALSNGKIETVSLDPNPDMAEFFRTKSTVPGATYSEDAFLKGFEDNGKQVPAYDTNEPFDVVHESMAFQFISPDRADQIAEAKRLLKPNGVLLTEEKVKTPQWKFNEDFKDKNHKAKYFSESELEAKQKKVGFSQSKDETKTVGMVDNMVSDGNLESILLDNFKHVVQYWDSGNFKGYAAGDNAAEVNRIVEKMGDLNSKFSTVDLPRNVNESETAARAKFESDLRLGARFQPGENAYVGDVTEDGEVRSKKMTRAELPGAQHERAGFTNNERWRLVGNTIYWWGEPNEAQQDSVKAHLERKGATISKDVYMSDMDMGTKRFANAYDKMHGQAQPKEEDFKMTRGGSAGYKKAWITPDGLPVQLGNKWHTQWLDENRDMLEQKYGITDLPKFEGSDTDTARQKALAAGFARINYMQNSGTLTVEARADDWSKLKEPVRQFAEANIGDVDNMTVRLLDAKSENAVETKSAKLFQYDTDAEKLANLPIPEAGEAPTMETASERLFRKAASRPQFQPREEQENLFGNKEALTGKQIADMTKDELKAHFPEAIVPNSRKDTIPSEITKSPLYKEAGDEPSAVKAFADKLVDFYNQWKDHPATQAGQQWYSDFVPRLKKEFGKDAQLMAELLAATSPQTNVETNFAYAYDALQGFRSGRFDKIIKKFDQGLDMIADDRWLAWYNRELNAGNIPSPPKSPTAASFLEHWIFTHNLKPTQSNGKLYGQHSLPVLQVFARRWMDLNSGPKTRNFVANLLGTGHEATIDLWADRTMRRLGYSSFKDRWRILPENVEGVSDPDFHFSQKAFRAAANQLGIEADDLQGALWFAEKQLWADNGWGRLDLGDFRKEMGKIPLLKKGVQQRLAKTQEQSKLKSEVAGELFEPRPKK